MNPRLQLSILGLLAALFCGHLPAAEPSKPNILFILTEDQGAHMAALGTRGIATPHMDALAAGGTLFTRAYVNYPVCSASKACLYTGLHPHSNGLLNNTKNFFKPASELTPEERENPAYKNIRIRSRGDTLVETLKKLGYHCGITGKLHVSPSERFPYDEFIRGGQPLAGLAKKAAAQGKPWFLFHNSIGSTHRPFVDSEKQPIGVDPAKIDLPGTMPDTPTARRDWAEYLNGVQLADAALGKLLDELESTGQAANTLIVFMGDHGPAFPHGKMTPHHFGLHVPLIIRGPGLPAGRRSEALVAEIDLLPTLLDLLGSDYGLRIQGRSLRPLLEGKADAKGREFVFSEVGGSDLQRSAKMEERSVVSERWHLIARSHVERGRSINADSRDWETWRCRIYDEIVRVKDQHPEPFRILAEMDPSKLGGQPPVFELYDLQNDPHELRNLAADPAHRPQLQRLHTALKAWHTATKDTDFEMPALPAAAASETPKQAATPAAKPNILVILADDMGYGDVGCYGAKDIRTPNLDRMAAEGMRFTSFYAQPICGPSRAALMTGCYPMRLAEPGNVKNHMTLPHPRETLLSEIVKGAGYATAQIGKWDLAGHHPGKMPHAELAPLQQGFDTQFGTPASNDSWQKTSLMRDGKVIEDPIDLGIGSTTRRYADEAIRVIRERKEKPFFIYLCPNMPHTALNVGKEFEGKSKRGLYGDVIEELDHHIGRILDTLRTEGIDQNTLVVFTSDNGPWIMQKEHGGSPGPLRGGKASTWEAGVRVPAIAWAPGRIAPGQTCDRIASTLDLLPTVTTLTGGTMPQAKLDGRDLSSWLLKGPPTGADDGTYCYYLNTHLQAVRQGKWKLALPRPQYPQWLNGGLRSPTRPHVLPADNIEIKAPLLYDLEADLGETTDVSAQHRDVVKALLAFADDTRAKIGDYDRIGSEARFFDEGPKRPDVIAWQKDEKKTPAAKPKAKEQTAVSASHPNIIVILADDLGYGDLGCYGAKDIRTPHLDKMAAEGLKLTSFYAQPICGPSRAALMTGCYPLRIGEVKNGKNGHTLPHPKEVTMAEMLRDAGYRTGIVGKWHLGMTAGCDPLAQGFQHGYFTPAFNGGARGIQPGHNVPFLRKPGEIVRTITNQAEMDTLTADCTREALEFIRSGKEKPFFLYLAYHMPHVPLGATEKFRGKSQRGLYGDVIEELDDAVGQVLAELKAQSLDDNTLVVFTSDNGPWTDKQIGDHGGSPGPFRGAKMTTWEGGWRVPGIVRWPGKVRAGETSDGIASTLDLLPTFAGMSGAQLPEAKLDGLDLTTFLTKPGAASPRETFLYHNGSRVTAVRHKDWKLVFARPAGGEMPYMPPFVTGHVEALPETALYNLKTDPAESKNLAAERPAVVKLLTKLADESRADLGDHTGPGSGARFFEEGPRWPIAAEPKPERTKKRKQAAEE